MTMGVATLAPWQYSSPTGGFISTERLFGHDLRPGMVCRTTGQNQPVWQGIISLETRLGVGLVVTVEDGTRYLLWEHAAMEIRVDCHLEIVDIRPCGCWDTSHLPEGGVWTCDLCKARHKQLATMTDGDWKQLAEDSLTRSQHGKHVA